MTNKAGRRAGRHQASDNNAGINQDQRASGS